MLGYGADDRSVNIGEGGAEASGPADVETAMQKLDAHCQALLTALPHGIRGVGAAREFIAAIPAAVRLGWSDLTLSAPRFFRMFHGAGLISRVPSDSDMPAAVRLVASVSGLATRRSERRWTVWLASACDPEHPLGASIHNSVTQAMLHRGSGHNSSTSATSLLAERDRLAEEVRTTGESEASLRAERDRLSAEVRATGETEASLRAEHAQIVERLRIMSESEASLRVERDQLAEEFRVMSESEASLRVERDQLAEQLRMSKKSQASSRDEASGAKRELAALVRERDKLRAVHSGGADELLTLRKELESVNALLSSATRAERASAAQLKSAKEEHKRELASVQEERLEARREAYDLGHKARDHASICDRLRERVAALRTEAEQIELRADTLQEKLWRESDRRELLQGVIEEIREFLGLPSFDPEQTDEFLIALEDHITKRDKEIDRLLAECGRELDLTIASGARELVTQGMSHQGLSTEDVEDFLRRKPEILESKIRERIERTRSRLAKRGVKLPQTRFPLDELDVE